MIDRLFLDTTFALAIHNSRDQWHAKAVELLPRCERAQVWVSEAVLTEVADGMATRNRSAAVRFIRQAYESNDVQVIPHDPVLFQESIALYESRPDKEWGLTDCISFRVMRRHGLTVALSADHHFVQAGFRALMLEEA